jgi:hypothetical protein
MKPPSKKTLKKKAWKLWSIKVRSGNADWKGDCKCFTCSVIRPWKELDAGHYIHRDSLDFHPINIQPQCTACNRYRHGNSGVFAYNIMKKYGQKALDELESLRFKEHNFTIKELQEIINTLNARG